MQDDEPMQIDETQPYQNGNDEQEEELSYRLVKRKYYCYNCQKEYNKMVSATDPLTCDVCNEGFCELVIQKNQIPAAFTHNDANGDNVDEEKKKADVEHRYVYGVGSHNRLDINDRSTTNIYGEPTSQRINRQSQSYPTQEEEKQ